MTIYIVALGSNAPDAAYRLGEAQQQLALSGQDVWSDIFQFPDRQGRDVPDYLNQCAILYSSLNPAQLVSRLRTLETALGRIRPAPASGIISMDIDLIAMGTDRDNLSPVSGRLPLPVDTEIPLKSIFNGRIFW